MTRGADEFAGSMSRVHERMIDAFVLVVLLAFAYLMRSSNQGLAGVIVGAAIQFWLSKNASAPHVTQEEATALAAAEVLKVAAKKAGQPEEEA